MPSAFNGSNSSLQPPQNMLKDNNYAELFDNSKSIQKVAVLGGLGFIGSHVCRNLVARGFSVRIFGRPNSSRELIADFEQQVDIIEGDITESERVLQAIDNADLLIHLIHTTRPGSSMNDPHYDVVSNVASQVTWLKNLSKTKLKKIFFISSGGTVYGLPQNDYINEDHPTDPICSYGITKLAIEKYIAMYSLLHGVDFCVLRPGNVYGTGSKINIGQGLIGVLADKAARNEPLEIWGNGESLRDYLHIDDMVTAVSALIDYRGQHKIFNVSSGKGYSTIDIANKVKFASKSSSLLLSKPSRDFDVPINILSSSRLKIETGWEPKVNIDSGIFQMIQWLNKKIIHIEPEEKS